MTPEERLAAVEQELADLRRFRLREAVKDLQEAMTVTTYAQARLERSHQDLAEWNESHTRAMKDHDRAIAEIREIQCRTDERIDKLTSAIGELTARMGIPQAPTVAMETPWRALLRCIGAPRTRRATRQNQEA